MTVRKLDLAASGFVAASTGIQGLADFEGVISSNGQQAKTSGTLKADKLKIAGKGAPSKRVVELRYAVDLDLKTDSGTVKQGDAAIRKALYGSFPRLKKMHLVDYKVRVVNSEAGTAARIRVFIESRDEHDVWGTVGVSENIIEASWLALVDALEYKLCKDGVS